jgi:F-type H+-transporting ATPase subunit epsilon
MRVTVIAPDRSLFEGEADAVVAPAFDGLVGILPRHAPFMTLLGSGTLVVRRGGESSRFRVAGGFLQVVGNALRVVAGTADAALLAALLAAGVSTAQTQTIRWGVGVGLQVPTGEYAQQDKLGWVAGGGGTYWPKSGKLGVRGDASYGRTAHDTSAGSTKIAGGMASLVYAPGSGTASVRPYVMGGLGFYYVDVRVHGFGSASESKVGFALGAGVMLTRGPGGSRVFAETRFTNIATSGFSTTFLPIVVGLTFGK